MVAANLHLVKKRIETEMQRDKKCRKDGKVWQGNGLQNKK